MATHVETHEVLGSKRLMIPCLVKPETFFSTALWKKKINQFMKMSSNLSYLKSIWLPSFSFQKQKKEGGGTPCLLTWLSDLMCWQTPDSPLRPRRRRHWGLISPTQCWEDFPPTDKGWWASDARCPRCCAIITDNNSRTGCVCVHMCGNGTLPKTIIFYEKKKIHFFHVCFSLLS